MKILRPDEIAALPQTPDGRTYITAKMVVEDARYAAFIKRTSDFWEERDYGRLWIERVPA